MNKDSLADRIRRGEPVSAPVAAVLSAATPITRAGMWFRLHGKRERVDARVISFGNITAGGTGKTPAVIARAREAIGEGRRVAVVTRGYHGSLSGGPHILDRKLPTHEAAARYGDEPALVAQAVPELHVIKSPDRVAGARLAIAQLECDTIILDDGYQYVRLERDENILLIDATTPFGNERMIPRGILREPISAVARATEIWLTRCDQAENVQKLYHRIVDLCPTTPIRFTQHAPAALRRICDGETVKLDWLHDREAAALCAIAHPEAFYKTLETLGARLTKKVAFPDHHVVTNDDIPEHEAVLTTEKDAIRLQDPPDNLYALEITLKTWER